MKLSQPRAGNLADWSWQSLMNGFLLDLFPLAAVSWPRRCVPPRRAAAARWRAGSGAVHPGATSCISRGRGQRAVRGFAGRGRYVQGEGAALWIFAAVTRSQLCHVLWWKAAASGVLITAADSWGGRGLGGCQTAAVFDAPVSLSPGRVIAAPRLSWRRVSKR